MRPFSRSMLLFMSPSRPRTGCSPLPNQIKQTWLESRCCTHEKNRHWPWPWLRSDSELAIVVVVVVIIRCCKTMGRKVVVFYRFTSLLLLPCSFSLAGHGTYEVWYHDDFVQEKRKLYPHLWAKDLNNFNPNFLMSNACCGSYTTLLQYYYYHSSSRREHYCSRDNLTVRLHWRWTLCIVNRFFPPKSFSIPTDRTVQPATLTLNCYCNSPTIRTLLQ